MRGDYDEFALLKDNAEEAGLPGLVTAEVVRRFVDVGGGRRISGLRWGTDEPDVVFLHGGAQNAHTWDTVALALDRPLIALDLPGHGHSDWREGGDYAGGGMAGDLGAGIQGVAPFPHTG